MNCRQKSFITLVPESCRAHAEGLSVAGVAVVAAAAVVVEAEVDLGAGQAIL
jgi:hypothetical protein